MDAGIQDIRRSTRKGGGCRTRDDHAHSPTPSGTLAPADPAPDRQCARIERRTVFRPARSRHGGRRASMTSRAKQASRARHLNLAYHKLSLKSLSLCERDHREDFAGTARRRGAEDSRPRGGAAGPGIRQTHEFPIRSVNRTARQPAPAAARAATAAPSSGPRAGSRCRRLQHAGSVSPRRAAASQGGMGRDAATPHPRERKLVAANAPVRRIKKPGAELGEVNQG